MASLEHGEPLQHHGMSLNVFKEREPRDHGQNQGGPSRTPNSSQAPLVELRGIVLSLDRRCKTWELFQNQNSTIRVILLECVGSNLTRLIKLTLGAYPAQSEDGGTL